MCWACAHLHPAAVEDNLEHIPKRRAVDSMCKQRYLAFRPGPEPGEGFGFGPSGLDTDTVTHRPHLDGSRKMVIESAKRDEAVVAICIRTGQKPSNVREDRTQCRGHVVVVPKGYRDIHHCRSTVSQNPCALVKPCDSDAAHTHTHARVYVMHEPISCVAAIFPSGADAKRLC